MSYEDNAKLRKLLWEENGLPTPPGEDYYSAAIWLSPCCQHPTEVEFTLSKRDKTESDFAYIRVKLPNAYSEWLNKRRGITCGHCGRPRRVKWDELLETARKMARLLPSFPPKEIY